MSNLDRVLSYDDSQASANPAEFVGLADFLVTYVTKFQTQFKRGCAKLLKEGKLPRNLFEDEEDVDIGSLDLARSLFKCPAQDSAKCGALLPFHRMKHHSHFGQSFDDVGPSMTLHRMRPSPETKRIALLLLNNLGYSSEATIDDTSGFERSLVCQCGSPNFQEAVGFGSMVRTFFVLRLCSPPNQLVPGAPF